MLRNQAMKSLTHHCDANLALHKARLYNTSQRRAVLDLLIFSNTPLSVNEILDKIGVQQKINKVTVYRILTAFKQKGIVREIETPRGILYYEISCEHKPVHPHFNCKFCGMLTCMNPMSPRQIRNLIAGAEHHSVEYVNVNITGTCKQCRTKMPQTTDPAKKGDYECQYSKGHKIISLLPHGEGAVQKK